MSTATTPEEWKYDFMAKQFLMLVEKINKIHEERSALMRCSVIATFGCFGWLFVNPDVVAKYGGSLWVAVPMWFLPFGFNCFGAWRNKYFLDSIAKHGGFFDYLLKEGMHSRNYFREYLASRGKERKLPHPSKLFWSAILAVSVLTAFYGIRADMELAREQMPVMGVAEQ